MITAQIVPLIWIMKINLHAVTYGSMAITLINLQSYQASQTDGDSLLVADVHFDVQCVIDEPEIIDHFNIIWVREGNSVVEIDFNTYQVQSNTVLFLSPGQIFTVCADRILRGWRIGFMPDFYSIDAHHSDVGCNGLLFNNRLLDPVLGLNDVQADDLEPLLIAMRENIGKSKMAQGELLQSYLRIFLIKCVQFRNMAVHDAAQDNALTEFNRLLEAHFLEWRTVADYANALFITPKALTKRLAKFDRTPSQLMSDRMVLEAKRKLAHTSMTVKEVAFDLGFDDPGYFSRFFRKQTGITPSDFVAARS